MKVLLPIPVDWTSEPRGDYMLHGPPGVPGLRMMVSPLLPLPEDPAGWSRQQFAEAVPPGVPVRVSPTTEARTVDGWPMLITEGVIGDESRLVVQVRFHDHGAAAIVRCQDPAVYARMLPELLDVLSRARPDWSGQPILSLSQLFEGVVKPVPDRSSGDG